jgi:hypothetical protein
MTMSEEYEPFGEEWKRELRKLSKETLIHLYRVKCIERLVLHDYTKNECIAFQQWIEARPVCGEWLTTEQLYELYNKEEQK